MVETIGRRKYARISVDALLESHDSLITMSRGVEGAFSDDNMKSKLAEMLGSRAEPQPMP